MDKKDIYVYKYGDGFYINLTNDCCNDCTFCVRNEGNAIDGHDLWLKCEPTAMEVIEQLNANDLAAAKEIVFCGYGECTYKIDTVIEVAKFIHSIGKKTRINTNGLGNSINNRDIVPQLLGNIDVVSISLNESDAIKYDEVSRSVYGLQAYGMILEFAELCVKAGIETIFTVVDCIPKEDIEICKNVAKSVGAKLRVRELIG